MERSRMEAFSDGVMAIIITIMVLTLKVPSGNRFSDIISVLPQIGMYALSFAYIGAYWNNHHHTLHTLKWVNGSIMWANLLFLFCISLLPFATEWFVVNIFDPAPTFVYGFVLAMTAVSFFILRIAIVTQDKCSHVLKTVMEEDKRGTITGIVYIIALSASMHLPKLSVVLYTALLFLWIMPDRKIEKAIYDDSVQRPGEDDCEE